MHRGSVLRTRSGWLEFAAFAGGLAGTLGPPRQLRALRCVRCVPGAAACCLPASDTPGVQVVYAVAVAAQL